MNRRATQDRYRAGGRRTSAQPLAASWRPTGQPGRGRRPKRRGRRRGLRGFLATYGWRVYAVPVLIALTVLVFIRIAGEDGTPPAENAAADQPVVGGDAPDQDASQQPKVTEVPAVPPNPKIPTAELPKGAPYTQHGQGVWDVLPGRGKRIGTGELFTYTIEVERGIDLRPFGGKDSFASFVDSTLAEPRGWPSLGKVSVQRVDGDEEPDIRISLSTPDTVHRPEFCGYSIKYESSCWRRSEHRVMINLARWVRGAVAFGGDMGNYRAYAINHEIGHAFGNGHVGCAKNGDLAPVMMQQTFGVANDYVAKLNDQADNADPVHADGKVCAYNPWPNPQARPPG